ncbi:MAG: aldose epimerase family protein [Solirubrobacteraceae bacterium]
MDAPETIEGYQAIRLRSAGADLDAAFLPHIGMVGASLRDAGAELLALPRGLARYARGLSTLGIPILHPWANRLAGDAYRVGATAVDLAAAGRVVARDPTGLPIHGVLGGSRDWSVGPGPEPGSSLTAELDFGAYPQLLRAFPFPHHLRLDVALRARTLTLRTTLTAGPDRAVPVSFGFHPYLALPGVPRAAWEIELPAMRHLQLDERGIPTGRSRPSEPWRGVLGHRTFDDGYVDVAPGATFALCGGGRRVSVRFDEGFPAAQIYAPPTLDVICFEPMTAPTNALVSGDGLRLLAPGASHAATFSITVDRV